MINWGIAALFGAVLAWCFAMLLTNRRVRELEAQIAKLIADRDYLRHALRKSQRQARALVSAYRGLQAEHGASIKDNHDSMMTLHWEVVKAFEASKDLDKRLQHVEARKIDYMAKLIEDLPQAPLPVPQLVKKDDRVIQEKLRTTLARLEGATEKIETLKAERELLVEHSRYEIGLLQENVMHTNDRLNALIVENQDLASRVERLQQRVSSDRSKMQRMRAQLLDLRTENSTLQATITARRAANNAPLNPIDGLADHIPPL